MNRQVGPSIVLSVSIVCFFAVALFQHDPTRPVKGTRPDGTGGPMARSSVSPRGVQRQARADRNEAAAAAKSTSTHHDRPPHPEIVDARRSQRAGARSLDSPVSRKGGPGGSASEPASEFTVVEANETIRDVAWRVYGSSDQVEALWRANRDSLPRRDTPLSAGVVLRTPSLR